MNTFRTLAIFILLFISVHHVEAQKPEQVNSLQFKIQLLEDNQTWGVFVRPDHTIAPSSKTSTGSGQVTIVVPVDFVYHDFANHSGMWIENARVNGPIEASGVSYISFGFIMDEPRIQLFPYEETLLFSFKADAKFNDSVSLFNNESDPFAAPNSYSSNPGNDLSIIDYGTPNALVFYTYSGNYNGSYFNREKNTALASYND